MNRMTISQLRKRLHMVAPEQEEPKEEPKEKEIEEPKTEEEKPKEKPAKAPKGKKFLVAGEDNPTKDN
jgi:hypothetical protein